MATATKPLHVLRSLLRHLKTDLPTDSAASMLSSRVGSASTTAGAAAAAAATGSPTQAFVLQQYRASQSIESSEETSRLRQLASDFLALQGDIKAREHLYSLDVSAENKFTPKEMSRRAAARAGLQLPEPNPDFS